jgi:LemA protein
MKNFFKAIIILLAGLILSSCGYNTMQANEKEVLAAWGDVEAAYQRRMDLIPGLVDAVKVYAKREKDALTAVTEARAKVGAIQMTKELVNDPQEFRKFQDAQGELTDSIARLMVVVERYPRLMANRNFTDLQHQLEGTENRINVARVRYNQAVQKFDTSIKTFPNSLINRLLLHLERKESL